MVLKELRHPLGLVSRQVVGDDVDLFAARLTGDEVGEKGNKLGAGMPLSSLAQYDTGAGVERGIEGERPVPVVLKAVALGTPGSSARAERDRLRLSSSSRSASVNTSSSRDMPNDRASRYHFQRYHALGDERMNRHVILTIASMLSILLITFHLT